MEKDKFISPWSSALSSPWHEIAIGTTPLKQETAGQPHLGQLCASLEPTVELVSLRVECSY